MSSFVKNIFRRSTSSSSCNSISDDVINVDTNAVKDEARDSKEYDLEEKIELEIKMQEGTSKLLAACRYQMQAIEAAKSLLTSTERMNAYIFELQKRKSRKQMKDTNRIIDNRFHQSEVSSSKGKVAISDIRMPLIWKDSDHFKNKGDCRKFAVFCLLKVGTQVEDTIMLNNVDRSMTDIAFDDVIIFNQVPHDFEFRLEMYSYLIQEDSSLANASNKLKKKISYSVSKAMGKRMLSNVKEDLTYKGSTPGPELVAHATLRLEDNNSRIKTHDLSVENREKSRHQLPLFGHFCCKMVVQPQCMVEESYVGYLSLVHQIGNLTGSRRMWSSLKNFSLCLWNSAAEIHSSPPDILIPIMQGTQVTNEENVNSYPRYTFRISNVVNGESTEFVLAADTSTELLNWISCVQQHIRDHKLWKPATDTVIEIPSTPIRRQSHYQKNRLSSLYDETPFPDGFDTPSTLSSSPINYEDNSRPHRISTPPFWSSSSSSSTSTEYPQTPSRPKSMFVRSTFQFN